MVAESREEAIAILEAGQAELDSLFGRLVRTISASQVQLPVPIGPPRTCSGTSLSGKSSRCRRSITRERAYRRRPMKKQPTS